MYNLAYFYNSEIIEKNMYCISTLQFQFVGSLLSMTFILN